MMFITSHKHTRALSNYPASFFLLLWHGNLVCTPSRGCLFIPFVVMFILMRTLVAVLIVDRLIEPVHYYFFLSSLSMEFPFHAAYFQARAHLLYWLSWGLGKSLFNSTAGFYNHWFAIRVDFKVFHLILKCSVSV